MCEPGQHKHKHKNKKRFPSYACTFSCACAYAYACIIRVNIGPFTLQKNFGTAPIKMVRIPKKWFGSDKFCSVNDFAVT